jgi:hypothetical protein
MPTEAARHRLYEKIREQWGDENADELMSYLPPVGWADVATRGDLDALRVATKQDLALLRTELRGEMIELRGEMTELRGEMSELRADIERGFKEQLRWLVGTLVGMTAIFSVIVSIAG